MGRPSLYTPELHRAIVAAIRAGSYEWVAAQANGIDPGTFRNWMRRGSQQREEPFLTFFRDVSAARAQARVSAEVEVRKEQPFAWLRFGPGRERADEPGWTESKEVKHSGTVDVIHSTEWARIASAIDTALLPYPDARFAVGETLRQLEAPPSATHDHLLEAEGNVIDVEAETGTEAEDDEPESPRGSDPR